MVDVMLGALVSIFALLGTSFTAPQITHTAAAVQPSISSEAPASCDAAKWNARGKMNDGIAKSVSVSKSGTLDECYGAILLPGRSPSNDVRDYGCTGREGVATFSRENITLVTRASSVVPEGTCRVRFVGDVVGRMPLNVESADAHGLYEMSSEEASDLASTYFGTDIQKTPNDLVRQAFESIDETEALQRRDPKSFRNDPDATWAMIQYGERGARPVMYDPDVLSEATRSSKIYQEIVRASNFGSDSSMVNVTGHEGVGAATQYTLRQSEHTFVSQDRWARLPLSQNIEDRRHEDPWRHTDNSKSSRVLVTGTFWQQFMPWSRTAWGN
jgi:hypothetical protein